MSQSHVRTSKVACVLVHGLFSNASTWDQLVRLTLSDPEFSSIEMLRFEYPSPILQLNPLKEIPDIDLLANALDTFLTVECHATDHVTLVGHSQGGLIIQRYLWRMLTSSRGLELAKISNLMLFACPTGGSNLLAPIRRRLFRRHPQASRLLPRNELVRESHALVLERVVYATTKSETSYPIPLHVFGGLEDRVVGRTSLRQAFRSGDVSYLPGDHSGVIRPDSIDDSRYQAFRYYVLQYHKATDAQEHESSTPSLGAVRIEHSQRTTVVPRRSIESWSPIDLGVHRAISASDTSLADNTETALMPMYVRRTHDDDLEALLRSRAPLLIAAVGPSSSGKSRACFEAISKVRPDWLLWQPSDSAELYDALERGAIPDQTVVWLDELHTFLMAGPVKEAADALRRFLLEPKNVYFLGSTWPSYWTQFITPSESIDEPDSSERVAVRLLLTHSSRLREVKVPPYFDAEDPSLRRAAEADSRIATLVRQGGGQIALAQQLAGGPLLVEHYISSRASLPTAWAILSAAMDARRIGYDAPLKASTLRNSVVGYLRDPRDRVSLLPDWFDHALHTSTEIVHGVRALEPYRATTEIGAPDSYRVHDYLHEYSLRSRRRTQIPLSTWENVASEVVTPADAVRVGIAAANRSIYRYAIPLLSRAADGDANDSLATARLVRLLNERGDVVTLRRRGLEVSEVQVPRILADLGDEEGLQALCEGGNGHAIRALAELHNRNNNVPSLYELARSYPKHDIPQILLARRYYYAGDVASLRREIGHGNPHAVYRLRELLRALGDIAGLEESAAQGDRYSAADAVEFRRAQLHQRGPVNDGDSQARGVWRESEDVIAATAAAREQSDDSLVALADALNYAAAQLLAERLASRHDLSALGMRADNGDRYAGSALAALLASDGNRSELRRRADAGDVDARTTEIKILVGENNVARLRELADAGDANAARELAYLLFRRQDESGLRQEVYAGNSAHAARLLIDLLCSRQPDRAREIRFCGLDFAGEVDWTIDIN